MGNHDLFIWSSEKWRLASIIEILYLKQNSFETDSCLLTLTTSTSHMQSCSRIDLGLIKLPNLKFLCLKARVFWWLSWNGAYLGKDISIWPGFQVSYCSNLQLLTMQKINPAGCFNLCHWRVVRIHLFPVISRKSSKSDFQSWRKNFSNDFALFS